MGTESTAHDEDSVDESRMTLGEHLAELRVRLIRSTLALVIAFLVIYGYREAALKFIMRPYNQAAVQLNEKLSEVLILQLQEDRSLPWDGAFEPPAIEIPAASETFDVAEFVEEHRSELRPIRDRRIPSKLQGLSAGAPFIIKIKNALMLALFVAGPVFLWEMWMFVAAGLYKAEKKVVYSFFPVMLALFLGGVAFGFLYLVPNAIYFLQSDGLGVDDIGREMEVSLYMQFLRGLAFAMGLVFQLPVAQVILSKTGVVDPKQYAQYRGHMAIAALVIAAIVTPPDPFTQILLAGPAIVLWEVGYWISRLVWTPPEVIIPEDELDEAGLAL